MSVSHCPACGSASLKLIVQSQSVDFKNAQVSIQEMHRTECRNCGYSFVTPNQHDANVSAARAAHMAKGAAVKLGRGLLTGEQLRQMREDLGLTQREASKLFGGGPVAFSKYENEDVSQSAAMDKLVRLVHRMGRSGVSMLRSLSGQARMLETSASARADIRVVAVNTATPSRGSAKPVRHLATRSTASFYMTSARIHQHQE